MTADVTATDRIKYRPLRRAKHTAPPATGASMRKATNNPASTRGLYCPGGFQTFASRRTIVPEAAGPSIRQMPKASLVGQLKTMIATMSPALIAMPPSHQRLK